MHPRKEADLWLTLAIGAALVALLQLGHWLLGVVEG